jgi:hypothetical protein
VTGRSSASAAETDVAVWFEAANSKTCDVAQQIFVVRLYFVTFASAFAKSDRWTRATWSRYVRLRGQRHRHKIRRRREVA